MLYYNRVEVSEGTGINRTSELKECNICHYWYFLGATRCLQQLPFLNDVNEL